MTGKIIDLVILGKFKQAAKELKKAVKEKT